MDAAINLPTQVLEMMAAAAREAGCNAMIIESRVRVEAPRQRLKADTSALMLAGRRAALSALRKSAAEHGLTSGKIRRTKTEEAGYRDGMSFVCTGWYEVLYVSE